MKTLITNCCLLDDAGHTLPGRTAVLSGNRIEKLYDGPFPEPSSEDLVIDANGSYLLPGLINMHVHINRRNVSRTSGTFRTGAAAIENADDGTRMLYAARNAWYEMLKEGVTTLRDLCSVGRTATHLKEAINSGLIGGPRLIVCGLGIAATGGHETHRYDGDVQVDGPAEIMKAVRNEVKMGADFIKVMSSGGIGGMPEHEHPDWAEYSEEEIAAAVFAAHTHKREVTVHAMGSEPVLVALRAGVDGIEHGTVLTDEALDIMVKRGVWYVPTASGIGAVADKEEKSGNAELAETVRRIVVRPQIESIKKAKARGLLIGAGSDTSGSVLKELLIFEQCGFTRKEALDTATANAAKILHMDDKIGYVREGYLADLILVKDDPMKDLNNLSGIEAVFKDGVKVTEDNLMRLV